MYHAPPPPAGYDPRDMPQSTAYLSPGSPPLYAPMATPAPAPGFLENQAQRVGGYPPYDSLDPPGPHSVLTPFYLTAEGPTVFGSPLGHIQPPRASPVHHGLMPNVFTQSPPPLDHAKERALCDQEAEFEQSWALWKEGTSVIPTAADVVRRAKAEAPAGDEQRLESDHVLVRRPSVPPRAGPVSQDQDPGPVAVHVTHRHPAPVQAALAATPQGRFPDPVQATPPGPAGPAPSEARATPKHGRRATPTPPPAAASPPPPPVLGPVKEGWTGTGFAVHNGPDGRYEGEWRDNLRHGNGILYGLDGRRYRGEWERHRQHGKGVLTLPNGAVTKGVWVQGALHGPAVFIAPDGSLQTLRFVNGQCVKTDLSSEAPVQPPSPLPP